MSGEIDTGIFCDRCGKRIPLGMDFCSRCGRSLSSAQLRASQAKAMTPAQFRETTERLIARLGLAPSTPVADRLKLTAEGRDLTLMFASWESSGEPDPKTREAKLQVFSDWMGQVTKALAKR